MAREAWTDRGYVFVDEAVVECHPHRLTKMFEDAVERTGVPRIRVHDTRHTMASLALEAGVHPEVVQSSSATRRSPSRSIPAATSPKP